MTPKDQSMLNTLNLLVMLSRSTKQLAFGIPEEDKYILTVTKQNLIDSDLTLPEFTNTLNTLAKKGYVWHMVFHDENLRSQINNLKNSGQHDQIKTALEKLEEKGFSDKLNEASIKHFGELIPKNIDFDYSDINDDNQTATEAFNGGLEIYSKMKPDDIGLVLLLPFRDIEILFNKINDGKKFEEIQDDGYWYDPIKYEFHIDGKTIKTSNRGFPNLVHFVLSAIFNNPNATKIDYEEIAGFDSTKGNKPYRDAMIKFINKHPKLKQMFSVHLYHIEFNSEKYNDTQ
ncbi:MAG: hypothetical protein ACOYMZ_02690 [Minisyncoccia bacterium]